MSLQFVDVLCIAGRDWNRLIDCDSCAKLIMEDLEHTDNNRYGNQQMLILEAIHRHMSQFSDQHFAKCSALVSEYILILLNITAINLINVCNYFFHIEFNFNIFYVCKVSVLSLIHI